MWFNRKNKVTKELSKQEVFQRLYESAHEEPCPYKTYQLAEMYLNGIGVEQDELEALSLYQTAANEGCDYAREKLEQMGLAPKRV